VRNAICGGLAGRGWAAALAHRRERHCLAGGLSKKRRTACYLYAEHKKDDRDRRAAARPGATMRVTAGPGGKQMPRDAGTGAHTGMDADPGPSQAPASPASQALDEVVHQLYLTHAVTMVRLANLLIRDRASAEDVVQDAFLSLYRALPRLRDHDQLLPYLRTAVVNGSRSALRGRRRAAQAKVHHELPESSAESAAMLGEDRRAVFAAVTRLPRRAREVLVLRYYLDLPDREIAATLGVSRGTVSSTASRALAALAAELREEL
jgi:RNA polymerase sigma-70 factor (sigma-E family)